MKCFLTILAGSLFAAAALAAPSNPTNEAASIPSIRKDLTFAADVLPIFEKACVRCHGKRVGKGLMLDSREGALKVVVPGDSASSRLISKAGKLGTNGRSTHGWITADEVKVLRDWIDHGAK
jgi:hypothetical protein